MVGSWRVFFGIKGVVHEIKAPSRTIRGMLLIFARGMGGPEEVCNQAVDGVFDIASRRM